MKKSKRTKLATLIQSAGPDLPSDHFTESVMQVIQAEAKNEVAENPVLTSLLAQLPVEAPPSGFTRFVMAEVKALERKKTLPPIISRKAWIVIAAAITALLVLIAYSNPSPASPERLTPYFIGLGNLLSGLLSVTQSVSPVYALTFVSVSILLSIDYFIGKPHPRPLSMNGEGQR